MTYLLDTNIASWVIRGTNPRVLERLSSQPVGAVRVSAITEGELRFGLARKPEARALASAVEAFLRHVEPLPWGGEAAACYGPLRASMEAVGTPMGAMDMLIAAQALAAGATLVSNDQAFRRVPGLMLEDWSV